jgi:hypothetical protein
MHCRIDAGTRVAASLPPMTLRSLHDTSARGVRGDIAVARPAPAAAARPIRHAERVFVPARNTPDTKHDARHSARLVWMTKHSRLALAAPAREERPRPAAGHLPLPRLTGRRAAERVVHRISEQRTTALRYLTSRTPLIDAPPRLHPQPVTAVAHALMQPMKMRVSSAYARPALRPELLVWRTPAMPEAESRSKGVRSATPCMDVAAPEPPVSRSQNHTSTHATAAQLADASRRLVVDAALADRLAEDVLRRVEKRVRIERERRGL